MSARPIHTQTSYDNMTKQMQQLQTSYDDVSQQKQQLQTSYDDLIKHSEKGYILTVNSSRYFVSTEKKSWNDAKRDCRSKGASLVIVNSKEDQEFLLSLEKSVWIGLADIDPTDVLGSDWIWDDATFAYSYTTDTSFWYPGRYDKVNGWYTEDNTQPDNRGGNERCAMIDLSFDDDPLNKWADASCGDKNYWICEKRI